MEAKNILVTGIGGNVGQGILRNLRVSGYSLRLVGSNVSKTSAGNHLCDKIYELPYARDEAYIPAVQELCDTEDIHLIIPSTDYESLCLARHRDKLPEVAACPYETVLTFTDKLETYRYLSHRDIPFAECCPPSEYQGQFESFIVKPREGRGSRNLHFNPARWDGFPDEEYTVQKLHLGKEITTAFYVDLTGNLVGHISLLRTLVNGATVFCRVTHACDREIERIIREMMAALEIRGACNIQYILDEQGQLHPFEINCRISGTNSVRANFGFNDTVWTIEERLYGKSIDKPEIRSGAAYRILMDVIFPDDPSLDEVNDQSNFYLY